MFKVGDIFIYILIFSVLTLLGLKTLTFKDTQGQKVEIYLENKLYRVEELKEKRQEFLIPTELGGIKVLMENKKIRVLSSNSPKKIIVKQGFISEVGETLIGIPDKVIIKIVGDSDLDYIIK